MAIIPVPSGRVSEMLVRQRLLLQLADSQSGLLKLETQISSGYRLLLPSDDAPAALRAIGLQQLLERKDQARTNLTTNQSFLSASDAALNEVSGMLIDVRGTAQSVVGAVATDTQRLAAAEEVHTAREQLINIANQQFRGRYLFAGSRSDIKPFESQGDAVAYRGNDGSLSSYADTGLLFRTNADGDSVFGAISAAVAGSVDLNPVVTEQTRLDDLHGGAGVHRGRVIVADGSTSSVVDLSAAETLADVVALLQHQPPPGRLLTATLTPSGINVELDAGGGGTLLIKEVAGGATASDLGILRESGSGVGPLVGADLDPRLVDTTPLVDLLGTRAGATIVSPGIGNDLVIEARQNGPQLNGVQVSFVNNISVTPGQEIVTYDANAQTLAIQINAGQSTADDVVNSINSDPIAAALFQARFKSHDAGNPTHPTSTYVDVTATATLAGGSGSPLDQAGGLQIKSGEEFFTVDISQARTVEDLFNKLNGSGAGVVAEINALGNGINVRSLKSGVDFSIGENGGSTATQLGIRSLTAATRLEDLNHGFGVHALGPGRADFSIRRKDGITLDFDVSGAVTIGDVIDLINNHPANQVAGYAVTARLATFGNGIELATTSTATVAPLAVLKTTTSLAGEELGLIPTGENTSAPAVVSLSSETITGRDVHPTEVSGAFTALVRLEAALRNSDDLGISRALGVLDESMARVNLSRAEIGARQQGLETLQSGLDAQVTTLKDSLSKEIDTDLPSAVSDLAGRQAAFQAALQTAATISKLTLLDFL